MSTLGKIVYLSEAQASELFANGSITVDETTITYSANDLYLTPENAEYVNKSGDTMTGALKAKGLRTYVSDTGGNASLNFGETADSTRVGRITMNTTTSRMEFVEGNERYFLPAPTASSETSYDILTSKSTISIAQGGTNATTAAAALTNLGAVAKSGDTMTGNLIINNGSNYKGIILKGDSSSPSINFYNTGSRLTIDQYANGSTGGERYLLPTPDSLSADVWYNIITSKNITQTLPGQLILSKTTDVSASASSEGALVIGTKTGQHLAFDDNEIMAKASATTVNTLNINYDGGNVVLGVNNASYNVQIRSTAGSTSTTSGALRVGGGIGVGSGIYSGGDITIQGPTYPTFALKRTDGTALGSFYASVNSGRVNIRTWNTAGTYYVDYGLPDDSDNDVSRARYFLTTKDFDFVNYSGTSGTMPGLVKSGDGIWLVSVYDSTDAEKYWVGVAIKKTSTNPVVQLFKNATITYSSGNTLGTLVFAGGSSYIAKALKIG